MKQITRLLSVKYTFLIVFSAIVIAGYFLLSQLPDVYESSARLAIENGDEYVFNEVSVDSDTLSQRVHLVITNVLGRENILKHLGDRGIVASESTPEEKQEAIDDFRSNALIEIDNVSIVNEYTGKLGLLSAGVIVSFRDNDPDTAYETTSALIVDIKQGIRQSSEPVSNQTEAFLSQQLKMSSDRLSEIGKRSAAFKNENSLYLPELFPVVVRQLDDITAQIERSRQNIASLERDRDEVNSDLAIASPEALMFSQDGTRIESPTERLEQLRIQRASSISRYSPTHPDVVRLNLEIAALEQFSSTSETSELEVELTQANASLSELLDRYSDQHPDVIRARTRIRNLTTELDSALISRTPRQTSTPSNPAYNRLLARRTSIDLEIDRTIANVEQLQERKLQLEKQMGLMPSIEQQLTEIERLEELEAQAYSELEQQLTSSRLSSNMRNADLLERFVELEPPDRPITPVAPRRKIIGGLIGLFAFFAAVAASLLHFAHRDAIWDRNELAQLVGSPVALIPNFK